jgi:hypothetical protein
VGLTIGRAVLLLAALACGALVLHVHRVDAARNARYGEIASEIAGRPVEVRCPGFWARLLEASPNEGLVPVENGRVGDHTDLSVEICDALDDVVGGRAGDALACLHAPAPVCRRRLDAVAFGVEALTHESWHLRGFLDEAQTECYTLQTSWQTGVRLGLPTAEALALADYFRRELYPRMEAVYHGAACVPGGPWDLHPETPAWPAG